jgi:hypothetical protein
MRRYRVCSGGSKAMGTIGSGYPPRRTLASTRTAQDA